MVLDRPHARNAVDGPTAHGPGRRVPGLRRRRRRQRRRAVRRRAARSAPAPTSRRSAPSAATRCSESGRRPDGPDPAAARQAGDRRDRGVRRRRRPRARDLVRPPGRGRGRRARRLLPALGRAAHRRRHGPAAPADRHRPGAGPDPHRACGRRRGGAADRAGGPRRAARSGASGGRGARPRARGAAPGLPAPGPALPPRAGGDVRGGRDGQRAARTASPACSPGRSRARSGSRQARAGTAPRPSAGVSRQADRDQRARRACRCRRPSRPRSCTWRTSPASVRISAEPGIAWWPNPAYEHWWSAIARCTTPGTRRPPLRSPGARTVHRRAGRRPPRGRADHRARHALSVRQYDAQGASRRTSVPSGVHAGTTRSPEQGSNRCGPPRRGA